MGHNFTSLISLFGEKGPNKFSNKGNLLAFGEVASASAYPGSAFEISIHLSSVCPGQPNGRTDNQKYYCGYPHGQPYIKSNVTI